ncbi:MAG: LysR family transcriptional regulator [Deferrisomatales bacterium]
MESVYWRTLVEVAEKGSFSRSAESLCVSQSAVSRRIQFLEEQYGVALLDRSGGVVRLTAAGRVVLEKARRILELEADLEADVRSLTCPRVLRFGCTPEFGSVYLPGILHGFLASYSGAPPRLRFEFGTPDQVVEAVRAGRHDLAVVEHCQTFRFDGCRRVGIGGDEVVFVSHEQLGLAEPLVSVDALFAHNLLVADEGACCRGLLEANLAAAGRRLEEFRGGVVFDDLHALLGSAVRGDGVAFLSVGLLGDGTDGMRIHRVPGFEHRRLRTLLLPDRGDLGRDAARFRDEIVRATAR